MHCTAVSCSGPAANCPGAHSVQQLISSSRRTSPTPKPLQSIHSEDEWLLQLIEVAACQHGISVTKVQACRALCTGTTVAFAPLHIASSPATPRDTVMVTLPRQSSCQTRQTISESVTNKKNWMHLSFFSCTAEITKEKLQRNTFQVHMGDVQGHEHEPQLFCC